MPMNTKRIWLLVALINFLLATSVGALLRLAFVVEIPGIKYQYLLHAHSHVAMLGWIYMALFALLVHVFVPSGKPLRRYSQLFWLTQGSVVGMLLSFPLQGYGPVSIAFSTAHILFSYVFVRWIWTDMGSQRSFSRILLKTALLLQVFSTLGVWLMGPIMAGPLRQSSFYYLAVQFYLHFQFNGWFMLAVLALLFKLLEDQGASWSPSTQRRFYQLLLLAIFLTYGLVLVWATHSPALLLVNSMGCFAQLAALLLWLRLVGPACRLLFSGPAGAVLLVGLCAFILKVALQMLVVFPAVAEAAYTIRNYIIGFIHLVLLGAVTFCLLYYAIRQGLLPAQSWGSRLGMGLLLLGFGGSELLLLLQGSLQWSKLGFLPFYYESLFGVSALIPIGGCLLVIATAYWYRQHPTGPDPDGLLSL